ncbi:MAG: PA14 domain-containing protein [Chloroflexota bacterium]
MFRKQTDNYSSSLRRFLSNQHTRSLYAGVFTVLLISFIVGSVHIGHLDYAAAATTTKEFVYITDYGADPSGESDSTEAIKVAIEAAGQNGTVYFPKGTYVVGTSKEGGALFDAYDGMTFEGETGAVLKCATPRPEGPGCRPFSLGALQKRVYSDITFRGLRFEDHDVAIRLVDTKNITIDSNYFFNSSIMVFADIQNDSYGNTGTRIINNVIEIPDYKDKVHNPNYQPNKNPPYSNKELDQFKYWIQFPIRVMAVPWDESISTSVSIQDVLIQGNTISGGAYNAIELAGHQVEKIEVIENVFKENHGVAIDFDKGVRSSTAQGNKIYDMIPTEQYDIGEMHAIGIQRGGLGIKWQYIPTSDITIKENEFFQSKQPYRKIRTQGAYNVRILDNVIYQDDKGGEALALSFTEQIVGGETDRFDIKGNDFLQGDILFAGDIWLDPEIISPILFQDNQHNGTLRIMNHTYTTISIVDNRFALPEHESLRVSQNNTVIKKLDIRDNSFDLGELSVREKAFSQGLQYELFNNTTLNGEPLVTGIDPKVDWQWGTGAPSNELPDDNFSVRWTGQVEATQSGTYTFMTRSDDGVRLWVDGKLLIDDWRNHAVTENQGTISLEAGKRYDLQLEYYEQSGQATIQLLWEGPEQPQDIIGSKYLYPPQP